MIEMYHKAVKFYWFRCPCLILRRSLYLRLFPRGAPPAPRPIVSASYFILCLRQATACLLSSRATPYLMFHLRKVILCLLSSRATVEFSTSFSSLDIFSSVAR